MARCVWCSLGLLLLVGTAAQSAQHRRTPPAFGSFKASLGHRRSSAADAAGVIYPSAFGADPMGRNDSTAALEAALAMAASHVVPGHFIGNDTSLGGVTVDLEGGEYRVSKPLWLASKTGGLRICCGSFFVDDTFPTSGFVLNAGQQEAVTVQDVAFDCNRRGGAFTTSNTLRVHLVRVYIVHYATTAIHIVRGHEVHVSDSFVGEFLWGEDGSGTGTATKNLTGTAIEVDGQDHWLSDLIIFSGRYGIVLKGGALVLTNAHIYNGGLEALRVSSHAVRILGCYFDFNGVVIIDPVAIDLSHSMFLGGTGVEIRSSSPGAMCSGLHLVHNQFVLGDADSEGRPWEGIYLNESAGAFAVVNGTMVDHNTAPPATYGAQLGLSQHVRSTVVQRTLTQRSSSQWRFEGLDRDLLFPISVAPLRVAFNVVASEGFPTVVARPVTEDGVLMLESEHPFSGTVYITVQQGM